MPVKISEVNKKSVCGRKGIRSGDTLLSINGNEINDVLDYRFYGDEKKLLLEYADVSGKIKSCSVKNPGGCDELGLSFETYLMDSHKRCRNSCIFCFIDQLPEGMRKSLYFKDDDSRLSFLFGNYITLTNLTEHDVQRIIKMHISPLNASVHTMNPELRIKMMRNPHAGEVLEYLTRFSEAGIKINAQLVLCPGINDGTELKYSLEKLSELENINSIAAVPVGLTKYREKLFELTPFCEKTAGEVIDLIDSFNDKRLRCGKDKNAYPSDEFYILANRELPEYDYYGDFPQLDNGVGLWTFLEHDFNAALCESEGDNSIRHFAIATGMAAFPLMKKLADGFTLKFPSSKIDVFGIPNTFFGEKVTVAGLLTGKNIVHELTNRDFSAPYILLPSVMFKGADELIFLDDMKLCELESELSSKAVVTECDGFGLFESFRSLIIGGA